MPAAAKRPRWLRGMPAARRARRMTARAATARASCLSNQRVEESVLIVRRAVSGRQDLPSLVEDMRREYGYFAQRPVRFREELHDTRLVFLGKHRARRVQQQPTGREQRPECCEDRSLLGRELRNV